MFQYCYNTELVVTWFNAQMVVISFCTSHSTVCSWQRCGTAARTEQRSRHSHLVAPLLVFQLALSANNYLNLRAVKVGKNGKDPSDVFLGLHTFCFNHICNYCEVEKDLERVTHLWNQYKNVPSGEIVLCPLVVN